MRKHRVMPTLTLFFVDAVTAGGRLPPATERAIWEKTIWYLDISVCSRCLVRPEQEVKLSGDKWNTKLSYFF